MRRNDVGERPTSRADLAGWYEAVLERQAKSGLSVRDYAARVGVSVWTLYEWRRRLSPVKSACRSARRPELVEVSVGGSGLAPSDGLVVEICDGRRTIAVPRGFDDDDLRRLVEVLESC